MIRSYCLKLSIMISYQLGMVNTHLIGLKASSAFEEQLRLQLPT